MAEIWSKAFGRYLRTLRQRRGLSLQDVCSLSQAFAETLDKGYLSRCENGHQGPAFSKIIPLSRIYDVPADVLLERLELDMELDGVGSPETDGLTYSELTDESYQAFNQGYGWNAYAYARDALPRARLDQVMPRYRDACEQESCASMNCATAARLLGRQRFALHEFLYVERTGQLGLRFRAIVLERLSQSYRTLSSHELAIQFGDRAIIEAEKLNEPDCTGYVVSSRAQLAFDDGDFEMAAFLFQKAHIAFRKADRRFECARALNNLAQTYFEMKRLGAARRALHAAEKLTLPLQQHRARALARILLGEIESLENNRASARRRWREAAAIAKRLDDKVLRFKAEFFLFKNAREEGNESVARSLQRRLRRLAEWIPSNTPELASYRRLIVDKTSLPQH